MQTTRKPLVRKTPLQRAPNSGYPCLFYWAWAFPPLTLLMALLLAGQTMAKAAALPIVDDAGRSVVLEGPPERIMTLAPGNTEIVFALGAGDRIVAVDLWSDYPPVAKSKPKISPLNSSLEQMVRLRLGLTFLDHVGAESVLPLERQGITG